MGVDEVVYDPVAVEGSLQAFFDLGVGCGGSNCSFVVGWRCGLLCGWRGSLDRRRGGLGVFPPGLLVFGSFGSALVRLFSFVFDTHRLSLGGVVGGRPGFPVCRA